jgi:hypothetical protein
LVEGFCAAANVVALLVALLVPVAEVVPGVRVGELVTVIRLDVGCGLVLVVILEELE